MPPKSSIPRFEECLFKFRTQVDRLVICDGLLCRRKRHPSGVLLYQIVIPHAVVPTVLALMHASSHALHYGAQKTIELFDEVCYWHGMRRDITELCSHCEACQSYRQSTFPPPTLPESCALISHPSSPSPPPTDISTDPLLHSPVSSCPPPDPPSNTSDVPPRTNDGLPVFTSHPPHIHDPVGADINLPSPPPSPSLPSPPILIDSVPSYLDQEYDNNYRYSGYAECDTSPSPSISPISTPPDSPDCNVSTCQFDWSLFCHSIIDTSFQDHPAATSSPQLPATPHIPSHGAHARNHDPRYRTRSGRVVRPPDYFGTPIPSDSA